MRIVETNDLYTLAESEKILVRHFPLEHVEALSLMDNDGQCAIAIDPAKIKSSADEKVKLAHDLGHCILGAFYNRYSPLDLREKHEYRANKWAVQKIIPYHDLQLALKEGYTDMYSLAEFFHVTQEFMGFAWEFYLEVQPME